MAIKLSNNLSLWVRRLAIYFILGIVVIMVSHIVFSYFGFLRTDVDSARYMLSSLVQSEAAIVALVVTLSLVAVQLAASSYSARVIEVFRRTPDLWILIGIYGVAIFYGLGVLKLVERANPQVNSLSNLEEYIAFSYYLGVFAFVALVPYMLRTLDLLKPSTVINMLAEEITKENILSVRFEESGENDPIQPIIDIVRGSMMKYDYETIGNGLRAIRNRTILLIKNENIDINEKSSILAFVFSRLDRVAKLAVSRNDEQSAIITIINLTFIGNKLAEQKLGSMNNPLASYITAIGIAASEQNLKNATFYATSALVDLGKTTAKYKLKVTKEIIWYLDMVFMAAIEQRMEYVLRWSTAFYKQLIDIANEYKLEDIAQVAEESFKKVNEAHSKLKK